MSIGPADAAHAASLVDFARAARMQEEGKTAEALEAFGALGERLRDATDPAERQVAAWSLMRSALLRLANGDAAAALRLFEEIVRRYAGAAEPALHETAADALLRTGFLLLQLEELGRAVAAWEHLIQAFGESGSPTLQLFVAQARFGRAQALRRLQRLEEAAAAARDFLDRYASQPQASLAQARARLETELTLTLGSLRRYEEIRALSAEAVREQAPSGDPVVRRSLAATLLGAIEAFRAAEMPADQLMLSDEYLSRFEDDAYEPRGTIAAVLQNRAVCLGALSRSEEELLAYEDVIRRFADCDEPEAQRAVTTALANRGLRLLERGETEEGLDSLRSAWRERNLLPERGRQVLAALRAHGLPADALESG